MPGGQRKAGVFLDQEGIATLTEGFQAHHGRAIVANVGIHVPWEGCGDLVDLAGLVGLLILDGLIKALFQLEVLIGSGLITLKEQKRLTI